MILIGKDAWDFIQKNREVITGVSIILIEEGRFRVVYNEPIEKIDERWFMSDFKEEWDSLDNDAYHILDRVNFDNPIGDVTDVVNKHWYDSVKHIQVDNQGNIINR